MLILKICYHRTRILNRFKSSINVKFINNGLCKYGTVRRLCGGGLMIMESAEVESVLWIMYFFILALLFLRIVYELWKK
jgi:hypothetical protein